MPREEIDRLVAEIRASHYEALRPGAKPRITLSGTLGAMPQMHIERIPLAPTAPAAGKTLAETGLRSRTGALVLSVRRRESDIATPQATFRFAAGDVLVVVGQRPQLKAAYKLLTGTDPA